MSEQLAFRPVIGTNAQILSQTPTAGYMWFATDSKKIYYSDGTSFLSMGGNTGIYYGIKDIPEDTDTDKTEFSFGIMEIDGNDAITDGNYKIPNQDDLILNIPDGCFYRVNNTVELDGIIQINTTRLTIAGGGGAVGPSTGILIIEDVDKSPTKYFTTDTTEAKLNFRVNNPTALEGNRILKITYTIGAIATVEDTEGHDFGVITFDLLPYISQMTTSTYTTVKIQVEDTYATRKTYSYYINMVELALNSGYKNSILMTDTGVYDYTCTPSGGTSLSDKEIVVAFYDSNGNHLDNDIITPVTIANSELPIEIVVPAVGAFKMTVTYRGKLPTGDWVDSNILVYQIVYYNEEPQLVVNVPTNRIEQYSTLNITYMVAAVTNSVDKLEVKLYKGQSESVQEVDYNVLNTWSIYFDTPGFYDLSIEALGITKSYPNIEVYKYSGKVPAINTSGLTLNLSATNRSNTELEKDTWTYGEYECTFNNFAWGSVNGWMKDEDGQDMLHLSAGATLEVSNFFPFKIDPMDRTNGKGQTIELDFKVSGVTDFSAGLIECLSYQDKTTGIIQTGFQVTGQGSTLNTHQIKATGGTISEDSENQAYNTQIQGCTAKFIENERIHLTWVIDNPVTNTYPMIRTYLNGVLSGLTQYGVEDSMMHNLTDPAKIIFNSTYGAIDIYNIRVYQTTPLADKIVLDNYIATYGTIANKTAKYIDNASVLDDNNAISIEKIEAENINNGYKLSVPYVKIIGGQGLNKDDEGYYLNSGDSDYRLPNAKKDYRLIQKYEFIDMSGQRANQTLESSFKSDGYLNGIAMYGQGTSSMEYPVKNLRFKAKMKDANDNKIKFPVNDCEVDLVCLKADYMESSGSHNTGTGNLVYTLNKAMGLETPGQAYWNDKVDYDVVSAIRGFPILVFFKPANASASEPYEFIGKYNFNLDKATHEPFGFYHDEDGDFGWTPGEYKQVNVNNEDAFNDYPFDLYVLKDEEYEKATTFVEGTTYYSIKNHIHCYEFLNNASNLANFLGEGTEDFETTFYKEVESEGDKVPNWFASYESRYPEFGDADSTDIDSWFRLCSWVNSTDRTAATNKALISPVEIKGITYDKDTEEYRLAKFINEFNNHFDFNFTCFYYILTHVLLMIDSRAKNMMIATWDDQHWYPIFYDMDTMLGLNNYGYNKFHYDVEDTANNVYNGQLSVLWNNFRDGFPGEIKAFYQEMQTAGLTYSNLLNNYNVNQADAVNEIIYNNDSKYKYIRPFTEKFIDNSGDKPVIVQPGTRDYLYASQGSRSMHRKWWLQNRINYFNGKYLSNAYKQDKYILRLYTPSTNADNYYAVPDLTEETFNSNKTIYYTRSGEEGAYIFTQVSADATFNKDTVYYLKASNALGDSLKAVPPNNDFTLTPLYNQYLSVAFGGDNGITTNPLYVEANQPRLIEAPSGAMYNDTETYLYGGSMLKDLGDLSHQYLGRFAFPETGETKLEKLTLGNPNNAYYNPNFSMLTIKSAAPYLKELEISNCSGLSGRGIDVGNCKNIQKVYATGTGITNIALPAYGVLQELRLPDTITSLTLIEQNQLNADQFTIGTCSYDAYDVVSLTETEFNANKTNYFIRSGDIEHYTCSAVQVTDVFDSKAIYCIKINETEISDTKFKARTYSNQSGKIIFLRIENTPIDSYSLIKNNPIQRFYLKDIDWVISDLSDLSADKSEIPVLEKLLANTVISAVTGQTKGQSLIGTITLKSSLGLTSTEAMALYTKYCQASAFPNINLIFEGLNIYDVMILNGNGTKLWGKKIIGADNGTVSITKEFLEDTTFGTFTLPTKSNTIQYVYEFTNKWYVNTEDSAPVDCSSATPEGWPIISDITPIDGIITLIPQFTEDLRSYIITFRNPYDESFVIEIEADYGTHINTILPESIPYRDDSELDLEKTYGHIGYNIEPDNESAIEFGENDIVTGDKTYYAIFAEMSVYDNIHEDYFVYTSYIFYDPETGAQTNGYYVAPKKTTVTYATDNEEYEITKPVVKGKVTIPARYNGLPVWGVTNFYASKKQNGVTTRINNDSLTHIFIAPDDSGKKQLLEIRDDAFQNCIALQYFDFKESAVRAIGENAFQLTSLQPNYNDNTAYYFGDKLYQIEKFAFNQLKNQKNEYTILIPSSTVSIDARSFCYGNPQPSILHIEIGSPSNYSNLDLSKGRESNINTSVVNGIFDYNSPAVIQDVTFYSNLYNNWDTEVLKGSSINSVWGWTGLEDAKSGSVWTLYGLTNTDSRTV